MSDIDSDCDNVEEFDLEKVGSLFATVGADGVSNEDGNKETVRELLAHEPPLSGASFATVAIPIVVRSTTPDADGYGDGAGGAQIDSRPASNGAGVEVEQQQIDATAAANSAVGGSTHSALPTHIL
ncbi:hypothetical protein HDU89_002073 [Geranomyces variabilis]|nr:hypothetical protein HDU89_002073 [Geranomyces variabilis]